MPTIVSRCQRIDLADAGTCGLEKRLAQEVFAILDGAAGSWTERTGAAAKLAAMLAVMKSAIEEEVAAEVRASGGGPGETIDEDEQNARVSARYRAVRRDFMITVMEYFRRAMTAAAVAQKPSLPLAAAFGNLQHVEEAAVRLDARNMAELPVLSQMIDLLQFPAQ